MAASQRPGFTGRSQTPPAQKVLVGTFFCKTLFLSLGTDFCLYTNFGEDMLLLYLLEFIHYFIDNLCMLSLVIYEH